MVGTEGTNHNTPCPYCGKMNHYVCGKHVPPLSTVSHCLVVCEWCRMTFSVYAGWEIKTRAIKIADDVLGR